MADRALIQLCSSVKGAGKQPLDVMILLQKLLANIKDNPGEQKFRSLNLSNPKLQQTLFCFAGSKEFLAAAGFEEKNGQLELPSKAAIKLSDAFQALLRRYSAENEAGQRASVEARKPGGAMDVDTNDIRTMSPVNQALSQLCNSVKGAGKQPLDVLGLLQKLLGNIKDNPGDQKFRSLSLSNTKLQQSLFCFAGSKQFLAAAGFEESKGSLELPDNAAVKLSDAFQALLKRYTAENEASRRGYVAAEVTGVTEDFAAFERYHQAVQASVKGAGRKEVEALKRQPQGVEALQILTKVLENLRRFPDNKDYKSVNMGGKAGSKLVQAAPLMELAGFQMKKQSDGGVIAAIHRVDSHVMDRLIGMMRLALDPAAAAVSVPVASGAKGLALGAGLGFAVGDALGAPLQDQDRCPLDAVEVDKALEMCGGGCHRVAMGQVTDDTELTICCADGLVAMGGKEYDGNQATKAYCEWVTSQPFDIADSVQTAFRTFPSSVTDCERRALNVKDSLANQALKRCVPLAIWAVGKGLTTEQLAETARADARLSHPNPTLGAANAAYVIAIASLLRNAGNRARALQDVTAWASEETKKESPGSEGLNEWLKQATGDTNLPFDAQFEGSMARVGFTHAFRHLKLGTGFEEAMRMTLTGGGVSTDTNAAIVGGLIGAAVGVQGIPEHCLRALLSCDTGTGRPRTPPYHPNRLPGLINDLIDNTTHTKGR